MNPLLRPLLEKPASWLLPGGPDSDVVLATRVRFARNLDRTKFPRLLEKEKAVQLCFDAQEKLSPLFQKATVLDTSTFSSEDKLFLVEKSIISANLAQNNRPSLAIFEGDESLSLMVNEEDHFRLQAYAAGLNFGVADKVGKQMIEKINEQFAFAESSKLGFLTSCPSNVGSGLRASVMVHLPAMHSNRAAIEHLMRAAKRSGFAVRGAHGEGSSKLGHMLQISYQVTLGLSHQQQLNKVDDFARTVVSIERKTRQSLLANENARIRLIKVAIREIENIKGAKSISSAAALKRLSTLRLAILCGLGDEINLYCNPHAMLLNFFQIQPGHIQAQMGCTLNSEQRDQARASLLRRSLLLPEA